MTPFHYELTAQLDAEQASGAITYAQHRAMREAMRKANMSGHSFQTMTELKAHVAGAGRDFKGRFH